MKQRIVTWVTCALVAVVTAGVLARADGARKAVADYRGSVLNASQIEALFRTPACLKKYRPSQSGPLQRIDAKRDEKPEPTYTVENIKVPSDGLLINGWLYLPQKGGQHPLVVLTNGGGNVEVAIKSLSEFMAPVLAHCGIAAFVHDKRGTGQSQGVYAQTTYDDYIRDAGNSVIYLSRHPRIDSNLVGVMGGSEGGRIAVLVASRYPEATFAISMAGTVVSMTEDRLYAQLNGLRDRGTTAQTIAEITPLWEESLAAWASTDPKAHEEVDRDIVEWRKKYPMAILPFTRREMETRPELERVLPTWHSLKSDYLSEMTRFRKKWFAMFGAIDRVVPTEASVRNIARYMALSGNKDYAVAVIPRCGHAPVDVETKQRIRLENLTLNWINENVVPLRGR